MKRQNYQRERLLLYFFAKPLDFFAMKQKLSGAVRLFTKSRSRLGISRDVHTQHPNLAASDLGVGFGYLNLVFSDRFDFAADQHDASLKSFQYLKITSGTSVGSDYGSPLVVLMLSLWGSHVTVGYFRLVLAVAFIEVLELPAQIHSQMLAHAEAGLPHEACGLFATGSNGLGEAGGNSLGEAEVVRVEKFFAMTNAAASQQIYQLDGLEMIKVEAQAEDEGLSIIGVMHSHTHTTAYPSPTDVADAARFDPFGMMHFIIVSLKHPEPQLRSYRIIDGEVSEEEVELV